MSDNRRRREQETRLPAADLLLWAGLVAFGALTRIYLQGLPNVAPIAALALFAGYLLRNWVVAACVPLAAMVLSDIYIGSYDWRLMVTVYAMLALPVAFRSVARGAVGRMSSRRTLARGTLDLLGCSLISSVLFFGVTNLASWWRFEIYERSLAGVIDCYVMALPFFRYTIVGDLGFVCLLFGGHRLAAWCASKIPQWGGIDR